MRILHMHHDVFNGDADGLCSLLQLRLATPLAETVQITGTKRDSRLLSKIEDLHDSSLVVLDVSLDSNRAALERLLRQKNSILYIDHHFAGDIPRSPLLTAHIHQRPEICTSLLVNSLVQGKFCRWAICGAFGDNLYEPAKKLARTLSLHEVQVQQLQEIGELLNYNSYGESIEDLHFHPCTVYEEIAQFIDPLEFFHRSPIPAQLRQGFEGDLEQAMQIKEDGRSVTNRVYFLPDAAWARRISGVFANRRAMEKTEAAHALITSNSDGSWRISVRAPLNDNRGADALCRKFPTGGGRAGAAGITRLPTGMLDNFLSEFNQVYR